MITPDQDDVWVELEDLRDTTSPAVQEIVSKRFFGKRKKGEITPHTEFLPSHESIAMSQILLYQSEDGRTKLGVRLEGQTVWLSQKQLTELFG